MDSAVWVALLLILLYELSRRVRKNVVASSVSQGNSTQTAPGQNDPTSIALLPSGSDSNSGSQSISSDPALNPAGILAADTAALDDSTSDSTDVTSDEGEAASVGLAAAVDASGDSSGGDGGPGDDPYYPAYGNYGDTIGGGVQGAVPSEDA